MLKTNIMSLCYLLKKTFRRSYNIFNQSYCQYSTTRTSCFGQNERHKQDWAMMRSYPIPRPKISFTIIFVTGFTMSNYLATSFMPNSHRHATTTRHVFNQCRQQYHHHHSKSLSKLSNSVKKHLLAFWKKARICSIRFWVGYRFLSIKTLELTILRNLLMASSVVVELECLQNFLA